MEPNRHAIEGVLHSLGVFSNSTRALQLIWAIDLLHQDPDLIRYITKGLYTDVASHFEQANYKTVERNIRALRDQVWAGEGIERLRAMTGLPLKNRPTTGEFIDIIRFYMEDNQMFVF